jgi:hypothetical protein
LVVTWYRCWLTTLPYFHHVPDYYAAAGSFSGLPVDIQNAMAIGGGGGGFAFKWWSGFADN